ncbi:MAG: ComEA family DNA-binding protein, partial [Plesiomonas shigelloides]
DELDQGLSGIGRRKAEAIVEYRTRHGAFSDVRQLLEVKGIGEGILKKNRERISL